ncbi:MAG: GIY-YIG nuclease family protein [Parcubacteria group bacterium]|nr:GIY-YIG nuclease family protein [Parcubacteria group bacterium]
MKKEYYDYIAMNKGGSVLYTGVTNNLERRMYEHTHKLVSGFTAQYNVNKLVYYELFNSPEEAIVAEKKTKGWLRKRKIELIQQINPEMKDLLL